ncbi:MAG: homoaconitase [Acidobacteria bacterium RBG_13_68_16]|nr:MAG: homoaconitase [Acidobacteria bacterium RBG_13_68_16]
MGQTIVEKTAQAHMAEGPDRPLRPGDFLSIRPRHVMTHDNTSAVISKFKAIGAATLADPRQPVFALDHDIQNTSDENLSKYRKIEAFAKERGVDFFPAGAGIGHQIMVEQGYVTPGSFVVASDSHSNMYGALGAVGTPVVRTDAAAIWATGEFWWQIPRTVQVVLTGTLKPGVSGKDVIIALCGIYNKEEVLNAAIEFGGPGVVGLSMDARLAIANMSTEWGALVGWFPVDEVTLAYLNGRRQHLASRGIDRISPQDLKRWASTPPAPDPDAAYAARIELDLGDVTPGVSGPDTVFVTETIAAIAGRKVRIHKAYLLSCVNSRLEDLTEAARVLKGTKVAPSVKLYLAAASAEIQAEAERCGVWQVLLEAGAIALPPGCGACIGLGQGVLEPGEVGISATNRNFKGRMGSRDAACYLASPAVVAASAAAGFITAPQSWKAGAPSRRWTQPAPPAPASEKVAILEGFPEKLAGRLIFLPQDNLNTDGIYGKDYTYKELPREEMARVVMENYDPSFAAHTRQGDIVVGGFNFGTGSSREQAVTALQAKGIPLVIAGSFSQTYLRNAFNNGFLCIETPAFVEHLRKVLATEIAEKQRTVVPGDEVAIDFTTSTLTYRRQTFAFPALGSVPQSLVVAGGTENLVRRRLGLG